MSGTFITFIIFALITLVAFAFRVMFGRGLVRALAQPDDRYGSKEGVVKDMTDGRRWTGVLAICLTIASLVWLLLSSFTIVGTKNVGIVTEFNRPVGTLTNGWHWVAPWARVSEWDGKLQNLKYSDTDEHDDGNGVSVRLGNQSTATVDILFQFRFTTSDGILQLFRNYGNEEAVKKNIVVKSLQQALNEVFGTYDPIIALAQSGPDRTPSQGMPQLAAKALDLMRAQMPEGIEAVSLTIVMPHYDQQTEDRIKAYNAAVQDTAIAKQREQTAEAIREANAILAQSNASPAVLYQNCLDMVERVVRNGGQLPPAFSCSQSAVVLPVGGYTQQ